MLVGVQGAFLKYFGPRRLMKIVLTKVKLVISWRAVKLSAQRTVIPPY